MHPARPSQPLSFQSQENKEDHVSSTDLARSSRQVCVNCIRSSCVVSRVYSSIKSTSVKKKRPSTFNSPILSAPSPMHTDIHTYTTSVASADRLQTVNVMLLIPSCLSFSDTTHNSTLLVRLHSTFRKLVLTTSIIEVSSFTLVVCSSFRLLSCFLPH